MYVGRLPATSSSYRSSAFYDWNNMILGTFEHSPVAAMIASLQLSLVVEAIYWVEY